MKKNEIEREHLNAAMREFFAGGGQITVVPSGVTGEQVKPLKRSQREHRDEIKRVSAERAKDMGKLLT